MVIVRRLNPYLWFLAIAVSIGIVSNTIAHSPSDSRHREILGASASLDLVFTMSGAYYWLLVRPGLRSKGTLLFVALLGLWRASILFPNIVPGKIWIGAGAEGALIAAIVLGLRSSASSDLDPVERLRAALDRIIPSAAGARAAASEFAFLYYALGWQLRPHVPAGARALSVHKRSGMADLMLALGFVSLLEVVPVHLVLARVWSSTPAWIATGLSIYGAIWMFGMSRSFALRPLLVDAEGIVVRYGLLFTLRIPADQIRAVRSGASDSAVIVPSDMPASVYIEFTEPLVAERVTGFTKRISGIGLSADDAAEFNAALLSLPIQNDLA